MSLSQNRQGASVSPSTCFFLAADAKYFPFACLAARRILDVSAPLPGFILQTGVPDAELNAANDYLQGRIEIADVSAFMEGQDFNPGHLSLAAYIRLFADKIGALERFERVVYTDADVLFNRSIVDLAETELRAPLLAAHDVQAYFAPKYRSRLSMQPGAPSFNSGVLVFDMPAVRRDNLLEIAREAASRRVFGLDQEALNVAFEGRWQTMHPNWNVMTNYSDQIPFNQAFARHFSWGKPWDRRPIGVEVEALAIYRDLSSKTPWADRFEHTIPFKRGGLKKFGRRFDALIGLLLNDEKRKRRARFSASKANAVFTAHADARLLAVQYPEVAAGFAANRRK
ncbi:MAG: hypothetical protein E5X80_26890 [Mesorhizobium sp.]|uniref:glycosyltransferase family 8 protein n=1 Tax=Mesorhizobium sp. TaxID=1871066 RepID=UPI000FE753AB|nr:glycosyltransferase [Mesorhizobium sp.]RWM03849.1 MAG: hypothetical protein EOR71_27070 [Mesorhizobium sp.]TIO48772.1 MAG: hypothetical protein E5X78_28240 [Mesorhizobium sp.]TIO58173.1 MAG: hypothetical protein E5X79_22385 [Mesorhizobium sp.]TJV58975.1 MAG: hypothetical protein E5X80_26890 [Mesorhizobium sp.]